VFPALVCSDEALSSLGTGHNDLQGVQVRGGTRGYCCHRDSKATTQDDMAPSESVPPTVMLRGVGSSAARWGMKKGGCDHLPIPPQPQPQRHGAQARGKLSAADGCGTWRGESRWLAGVLWATPQRSRPCRVQHRHGEVQRDTRHGLGDENTARCGEQGEGERRAVHGVSVRRDETVSAE